MLLPVNEVFETMQGEATFTGSPALFIRLQGCKVGCSWCDTKHTWDVAAADQRPMHEIMGKVDAAPTYGMIEGLALAELATEYKSGLAVITGGEPCSYDLRELTSALLLRGKKVQVETSGTQEVRVAPGTWVTLSPKIGMPGGYKVRPDAVWRANEIKMPVGKPRDVDTLLAFLAEHGHPVPEGGIWVQPLSRSPKATELCMEMARYHGWRISVQVHAFIGVR